MFKIGWVKFGYGNFGLPGPYQYPERSTTHDPLRLSGNLTGFYGVALRQDVHPSFEAVTLYRINSTCSLHDLRSFEIVIFWQRC